MSSPNDISQSLRELLQRHLEDLRDLRSEIPSLALIYPQDQYYLKSGFVSQKWALKLCCMYPGKEHPLKSPENHKEGETNPAFGIYYLEDLGELTGPIIKWMSSKAKIAKVVFPRLGGFFEWVEKNEVTSFLKSTGEKAKDISLPESQIPSDGKFLPISSEYITLAGLDDRDYREIEGQGLIFLQQVIQKHGRCGNLRLFVNSEGRKLWLCREHEALMKAERDALTAVATGRRTEELWSQYRERLSANVSKVRLLGEPEWRELKQVFVKLTIVEEYQRPSARNEWMGFVDTELRRRRALFSDTADEEKKEKRLINPEELLRDGTRTVTTGAPGCGKSTLLRWLAGRCLEDNSPHLPVFLELKSINKKLFDACSGNLRDLLFEQAVAHLLHFADQSERAALKAAFTDRLDAGRAAIFLDGLDEVRNADFFVPLCESINRFLDSPYGRNLLLISTRPYALDVRFRDAQEMEIAPLNQAQVADFLKHYYGSDPRVDLQGLLQQLGRRELGEMVRVPVVLGALVRRYREKGELTGDRLKLYEDLVHDLVVTRDAEDNVERFKIKDEDGLCKLEFLEQFAFKKLFVESAARRADELWTFTTRWLFDEAKAYCPQFDIKPQDFVADVKATALLREVAKGVWAFSHLTIQEYLAARVLARKSDFKQIFCRNYFNPTLVEMEALPMALGLLKEPDEIYWAIEQLPESLNFVGVRLRARGLTYGAAISHNQLVSLTDQLISFVSHNRIEETSYSDSVIRSFSKIGGKHSDYIAGRTIPQLRSEDSAVCLHAAYTLGEIGAKCAVQALLDALKDEKSVMDANTRATIVMALGLIGGEQAAIGLIISLQGKSVLVRLNAARGLEKIGGEHVVTAWIHSLQDKNSHLRKWIVEKLKNAKKDITIDNLIAEVRETLQEKNHDARFENVKALVKLSAEYALFAHPKATTAQERPLKTLRKIRGDEAVHVLIEALKDNDSNVRSSAAKALQQLNAERLVEGLESAMSHKNSFVRRKAAEVIGYYSNSYEELKFLAETDPVPEVRQAAERALSQLESKKKYLRIVTIANQQDPNPPATPVKAALRRFSSPIKLFISYSHRDEDFRMELDDHLSNLQRQQIILGWHDRQIMPGQEWANQIDDALDEAQIILLLISARFMASDYCYAKEMIRAITRHDTREAVVIPIILSACDWQGAPFSKLQALPKDARPINSWDDRDEAWLDVVRGLRRVIDRLSPP
jgi:HEAT repeat protein/energy-coupling factor transporter ATP-binding protein EcfA2